MPIAEELLDLKERIAGAEKELYSIDGQEEAIMRQLKTTAKEAERELKVLGKKIEQLKGELEGGMSELRSRVREFEGGSE